VTTSVLVAGIDEAGRGCVIGPLVVAGLTVKEEALPVLSSLGVRDSKLLTAKNREFLFSKIVNIATNYIVLKVSPVEIDKVVECSRRFYKLNRLEAQTMAQIITVLKPDIAYVDAADVLSKRFGHHILEASIFKTQIISEHKADRTYPIVSAASILAKVERDKTIKTLREEYGDFGTGYPSDHKTGRFLKEWLKTHEDYPDCVRKSWKPAKQAKACLGGDQQKLF
jgi:ribonuclease HII